MKESLGSREVIHTVERGGERIDLHLAGVLSDLSRSRIGRLIGEGRVTVGGRPVKPSHKVSPGEVVRVVIPGPEPGGAEAEEIPLEIIHEDRYLLAVNKPSGLVVHPAPGHRAGTLVNALMHHISDLSGIGGVLRPGIVHRLDKDTSGLLLVAKDDLTHRKLQALFRERSIGKSYLALVVGRMTGEGVIDKPIGRHKVHRKKFAVGVEGGRPALTRWRAVEELNGATLLEVVIETGRTHQIRVHLASAGHPVVNDPVYGGVAKLGGNKVKAALSKLRGQALHAWKLTFDHPATGERLTLTASPDPDFLALAAALRGEGRESPAFPDKR